MTSKRYRAIAIGIVLVGVLRADSLFAQQLQPLAPEAKSVENQAVNQGKKTAPTKASTNLVIPSIVLIGVQGLDVHSTWMARASGNGVEGNPLMDAGTGAQIAIKAASAATVVYLAHRLQRRHPKLAKGLLWGGAGLTAGIAAHNYQIARR